MLQFGRRRYAVTCAHVVAEYERLQAEGIKPSFQIGSARVDLNKLLVHSDTEVDFAVIDVTDANLPEVEEGQTKARFFEPGLWPPPPVTAGDRVMMAGLPGTLRKGTGPRELTLGTFAVNNSEVVSASPTRIVVLFEREKWVSYYGDHKTIARDELGGLSGGPVFIGRETPGGIRHFDFVGIITEHGPAFDVLHVAPAGAFAVHLVSDAT